MMSSISEDSKEDENEKETNEKIININLIDRNLFNIKMSKIKEEIRDYIIDKYYNIIYKQNKEIEKIKKEYDDLVKKSSNILKIVINNKMQNEKNDENNIKDYNYNNNQIIEQNKVVLSSEKEKIKLIKKYSKEKNHWQKKIFNKNHKRIERNNEGHSYVNKKKISSSKIKKLNNFNNSVVFNRKCNSNRFFIRTIDSVDKENINNNSNLNNKTQVNNNYLKEINKKDFNKIKFIKQKLLNSSIKNLLSKDFEVNFKTKKGFNNNTRNKKFEVQNNLNKIKVINNNSFKPKNKTSFNTPKKNKENNLKNNKLFGQLSSFNVIQDNKSENNIKFNPVTNFYINEFVNNDKSKEKKSNKTFHGRFFSVNNSIIKQNERNIIICSFNKIDNEKSSIIYNPKFDSFLNRCEN